MQGTPADGQCRKACFSKHEDNLIEDLQDQLGLITGLDIYALQSVLVALPLPSHTPL